MIFRKIRFIILSYYFIIDSDIYLCFSKNNYDNAKMYIKILLQQLYEKLLVIPVVLNNNFDM